MCSSQITQLEFPCARLFATFKSYIAASSFVHIFLKKIFSSKLHLSLFFPPSEEAEILEREALVAIFHLISRTSECLALLQLLCYHQFHVVTSNLPRVALL